MKKPKRKKNKKYPPADSEFTCNECGTLFVAGMGVCPTCGLPTDNPKNIGG